MFRCLPKACWPLLLALAAGCATPRDPNLDALAQRMLPSSVGAGDSQSRLGPDLPMPPIGARDERFLSSWKTFPEIIPVAATAAGEDQPAPRDLPSLDNGGKPLSLPEAIDLAFRLQPRLRVYLESLEQARGAEDIAFAPFLPFVSGSYSVGGFHLDSGGAGIPLPSSVSSAAASFNILPPTGAIPVGLDIDTRYALADLKLQWLLCDFGRRLGRYRQAALGVDIAQLQSERAYQTVANEVATAYYALLRAQAVRRAAQEAVRREEADLEVARNLSRGGELVREKVLRAEVVLAQAHRLLDSAEAAVPIAASSLNLAIGLNVNTPTCVVDLSEVPAFTQTLCDCLQLAVSQRREFMVAHTSIQVAHEGTRVAKADFAPRIVAEGLLLDFQQTDPRGHLDLPVGFIKLEWGLFEGGKRVAELHVADSKVRTAVAQAQSIADTIGFQVNEAYFQTVAARRGIDRARPAVEQAQENARLVRARYRTGDATPTEITDAETALTRAQVEASTSLYDYFTALARLEYAMGSAPIPGRACKLSP
jgi:outer membrane protein TolC